MAAAPRTCSPACQRANHAPECLTHHGTGERCHEESRLCSRCTNKESVNDLNFSPSLGVFYKLCVSCLGLSATHGPFVLTEKAALIISIMPPSSHLSVHVSLAPFTHLLSRGKDRLFTGVHSVLKVFKHHQRWWGGHQGDVRTHDTHSIPLQDSHSQYTLCYNRNTGVIYPPCFIRL